MKKLIVALVVVAVFSTSCVYADDSEKMTFDNVTFGKEYKIKGYAAVKFLGFKFVDAFAQWKSTEYVANNPDIDRSLNTSGNEADFAWLKADVRNLMKSDVKFIDDISVKIVYDDEYEYNGWVRQFYYDYSEAEVRTDNKEIGAIGSPTCLSNKDEIAIGPLYVGHYVFGCTLPMSIIEDKDAPLRMVVTMKGNEFTYSIR